MSFAVRHIRSTAPGAERALVVMLPGLDMTGDDFVQHGFSDVPTARRLPIDSLALSVPADDYFERGFADTLHEDVVRPYLGDYRRILVMGISLGAMGALFYARAYDTDGVVLLAPFLGTPGTIASVERAGGLAGWEPGTVGPRDLERGLLAWLKGFCATATRPWILLGYGTEDRFSAGSRLLAAALPGDRILALGGGHDWATWSRLWNDLVDHPCLSCATRET